MRTYLEQVPLQDYMETEAYKFSYYNTTTQEGMRLDNSGRLLINTTSSIDNTSKLQIVGDSGSYARITMQDVDGTNQKTYFQVVVALL